MVEEERLAKWRYEQLVWVMRWLAAEPDAALAAVEDPRIAPDEIALSLDDVLVVGDLGEVVNQPALDLVLVIDQTFDEMSGQEHAELWTLEALTSNALWTLQRDRARDVLQVLGEQRADDDLRGHV